MKLRLYTVHVAVNFGDTTETIKANVRCLDAYTAATEIGWRLGRKFKDIKIISSTVTKKN